MFQHRCFPVNIAKFLRTPILKNICKLLFFFSWNYGLFHGIRFFYPTNSDSLAAFRLSGRLCEFSWYVQYEWSNKDRVYIQKVQKKKKIFLVFEEITFQHFLFIHITKSRFFLFFSDHTDIKKWKLKINLKIMTPA